MGNCKDCRSWDQDYDHSGKCIAARYLKTDYTGLVEQPGEYEARIHLDDNYDQSSAELLTGPLFGCVQFQLKNR